jgi:hypothetical protein
VAVKNVKTLQGRRTRNLDGQQERVGKLGREFSGISAR